MTDRWDVRNSGRATIYEGSCPFNIVRFLLRKVSVDEYSGEIQEIRLDPLKNQLSVTFISKNFRLDQRSRAFVNSYRN